MSISGRSCASNDTGLDLLHHCKEVTENRANFMSGQCAGFVEGMIQGVYFMAVNAAPTVKDIKQPFCIAKTVSNEQIIAVLVKYLNDHPEKLDSPAAVLFVLAMENAFACSK